MLDLVIEEAPNAVRVAGSLLVHLAVGLYNLRGGSGLNYADCLPSVGFCPCRRGEGEQGRCCVLHHSPLKPAETSQVSMGCDAGGFEVNQNRCSLMVQALKIAVAAGVGKRTAAAPSGRRFTMCSGLLASHANASSTANEMDAGQTCRLSHSNSG